MGRSDFGMEVKNAGGVTGQKAERSGKKAGIEVRVGGAHAGVARDEAQGSYEQKSTGMTMETGAGGETRASAKTQETRGSMQKTSTQGAANTGMTRVGGKKETTQGSYSQKSTENTMETGAGGETRVSAKTQETQGSMQKTSTQGEARVVSVQASGKRETIQGSYGQKSTENTVETGASGETRVSAKTQETRGSMQKTSTQGEAGIGPIQVGAKREKTQASYEQKSTEKTVETGADGKNRTTVTTNQTRGKYEQTDTQAKQRSPWTEIDVQSKTTEASVNRQTRRVTEQTNEKGEKEIIIEDTEVDVSVKETETKINAKIKKPKGTYEIILDVIACLPAVGCVNPAKLVEYVKTGVKYLEKAVKFVAKAIPYVVNAQYSLRVLKKLAEKWKGKFNKFAAGLFKQAVFYTGLKKGKVVEGAKKQSGYIIVIVIIIIIIKREEKEVNLIGKCFTGDTLVLTKSGYLPIRQIQIGDDIYSRNDATNETGFKKVKEVFQTEAHTIYHIRMAGKAELKTTAYHPIFVKDKGWVNAINLKENMLVETMDGSAQIMNIEKIRHEEPVEVFNFHVEDWESYFVSEKSLYVHNSKGVHTAARPHGTYKDAPYHPSSKKGPQGKNMPRGKGVKSERPKNGQAALDNSVPAKSGSSNKRLSREGNKAVVLHQHSPGEYHGFLKDFKDLPQEDKNVLIEAGIFNRRGK